MRLSILVLFGAAALMLLTIHSTSPAENHPKENTAMLKAVIHVNFGDADRQGHALKNIENILKELGDNAQVELVAHGAGIGLLVTGSSIFSAHLVERRGARADGPPASPPRSVRHAQTRRSVADGAWKG